MPAKALIVFLMWSSPLMAMGLDDIRDTIFELPGVEVHAKQVFRKENAGMTQTEIDPLIFVQKVNLNLSDLLSENSPVFIKNHGRGALATASFRGTASSHTQVNWNGIPINSPMLGMVDFSLIPVFIIDEMHLRHGSASIADGSGGLGGSIHITNRADWDNTFGLTFLQGIGSYRTFEEYLKLSLGNRSIQWKSRFYHNQSKNDFTFINRHIGDRQEDGSIIHPKDTNKNANYIRYGTLQELYFMPAHNHMVTARWWGQHAQRSIPQATSFEGPENTNLNNQKDTDHRLVADWQYYTENSKWLLRSGYTRKQLDYTLKNHVSGLGRIPAIYSQSTQQSYMNHLSFSNQIRPNFSVESSLDLNRHKVSSADSVSKQGYSHSRWEYSGLVAARYSLAQILNLNLMLRHEKAEGQAAALIPFAGFDLRIWPQHDFIIRASIARNYHHPTLNDLYWQPGGNPNLQPEEGFSLEAGIFYQKKFRTTSFQTQVTAYRYDINNWIIWLPGLQGYWQPENIKRVLSKGLEASSKFSVQWGKMHMMLAATYAYTRSVNHGDPLTWGDKSVGKQLVYIPVHSGNIFFNLQYRRYRLGWQHNSYSERYTTTSNDFTRRDWLYPYHMNDLSLARNFEWDNLKFSAELKIYNLFDETYHTVLHRPMPGRNYMLLLRAQI